MLTGATRLAVRRPSPTTVSYEVSNAHPRRTLAARGLFVTSVLLRAVVGTICLVVLLTKLQCVSAGDSAELHCQGPLYYVPQSLQGLATGHRWPILMPVCLGLLFLCIRRFHTGAYRSFIMRCYYGFHSSGNLVLKGPGIMLPLLSRNRKGAEKT